MEYIIKRWDPILVQDKYPLLPRTTFSISKTNSSEPIPVKVIVQFTSIYGLDMAYNNKEFDGILYSHLLLPIFHNDLDIIVMKDVVWCDYPDTLGICFLKMIF